MKVKFISGLLAAAAVLGMSVNAPALATEQEKQLNILATQMYMNQVAGQQAAVNPAYYNQSYSNRWHRKNHGYNPTPADYGNQYSPYYNPQYVNPNAYNPYLNTVNPYNYNNYNGYNNNGANYNTNSAGLGTLIRQRLGF